MPNVLIVEDDPQISKSLKINLKLAGIQTELAASITEANQLIKNNHFDLICLDIGLPDGSGLDFCKTLREAGDDVPILFLSALTDEETVVKAINNGGDDYLRKPYGVEELKVRMNKLMRKFSTGSNLITFGPLTIDPMKRVVTIMGQMVNLGRKEMEILMLLAKKSGNIVTRDTIMNALYDSADLYDRTIDSHMSHLRRKLKEVTDSPLQINSVYGLGYRLECK